MSLSTAENKNVAYIHIVKSFGRTFGKIKDSLTYERIENMNIVKIVITGGPCGGKTTALEHIKKIFSEKGWTVLFVPETATELINTGVTPLSCKNNMEFQCGLMRLQLEKERVYMRAALGMRTDKVLIVCDRGAMDNKAYMGEDEFNRVLSELDENETNLRDRYDAVFHLVTAADGAESYYSYANNSARYEDINTAREVDRKIISAWVGHSHLRIIDNSTGFDKKIERLIEQIISFVGDPEPIETERKYLVEIPDVNMLEKTGFCRKVNISQSYLNYPDGTYFRIRKRGCGENYIYIKTVKKKINDLKRVEIETRLTKDEYNALLNDETAQKYTLDKVRYCIVYKNQYFELDVFPFMKDTALLEIELIHGSEKIDFPPYIKIIREVTFDDEYKNYNIAKRLSAET